MPHRVTPPSSSSSTATTAPARAKSPWRRASSSTAKPHRPSHTGKPTPTSSSSSARSVLQVPWKNSDAGIVRRPARRLRLELGVEGQRHRRVLGGRVGVGDRAADGAAVADLEVADERRGPGEQRRRPRPPRRTRSMVAWVVPAPIHSVPLRRSMRAQLVHPAQVDEVLEDGQAQGQHRHEALAAGEHLGGVAELGEQPDGLVDGRRARGSRTVPASRRPPAVRVEQGEDRRRGDRQAGDVDADARRRPR